MSTFFDNFTLDQTGTVIPNGLGSNGSFGVLSGRVMSIDNANSTMSISGGMWNYNSTDTSSGGSLRYQQQATEELDMSNLFPIVLQGSVFTQPFPSITMSIRDTFGTPSTLARDAEDGMWIWSPSEFQDAEPTINLMRITFIEFIIISQIVDDLQVEPFAIMLICIAKGTNILMVDKTEKPIEDIVRGDLVASDPDCKTTYKVARVNVQYLEATSTIEMLAIEKDALGMDSPRQPLVISPNHPIFFEGKRRPASCFRDLKGVRLLKVKASDILKPEKDNSYRLYDLQFEVDGSYVAEGVTVQSRSPYSDLTPLPRELYFDDSLYKSERTWDSLNQPLPLDRSILPAVEL